MSWKGGYLFSDPLIYKLRCKSYRLTQLQAPLAQRVREAFLRVCIQPALTDVPKAIEQEIRLAYSVFDVVP